MKNGAGQKQTCWKVQRNHKHFLFFSKKICFKKKLNFFQKKEEDFFHKILFEIHRKATAMAIHKAMNNKPDIDWLLENQDKITHKYYQMGLDGKL